MTKKEKWWRFIAMNGVGVNGILALVFKYHATFPEVLALAIVLVVVDAVVATILLLQYRRNEQ